jgi:hypothetical protein
MISLFPSLFSYETRDALFAPSADLPSPFPYRAPLTPQEEELY